MDPSLMTPEEIERRGRVIIDPCLVCHHNRQAHVIEGVFLFEVHGQRLEREITDACIACDCLEYVELTDEEGVSSTPCCSFEKPHPEPAPLGVHWVTGNGKSK